MFLSKEAMKKKNAAKRTDGKKHTLLFFLMLGALLPLPGCAPTRNVRGNMVQDYQIAEITAGRDTQTDVLRKLGSPTTKAPFDENIWYYLGQEMEKRGILDPQVTQERIVRVSFDANGTVQEIQNIENQRLDLPYAREKTPTSGNEITFTQQLLGNLGKFNKDETAPQK